MKTAKFIKNIDSWHGDARLYRLSEAIRFETGDYTQYVIVSAVDLRTHFMDEGGRLPELFAHPVEPLETFIFPADKDGCVLDWGELEGSYRGDLNHERALNGLGFELSVID
jgi:hypothetical protein